MPTRRSTFDTTPSYTAPRMFEMPASSRSDLYYDPNTGVGGDAVKTANGTFQRFSMGLGAGAVTATLVLATTQEHMSNRVVIFRRN